MNVQPKICVVGSCMIDLISRVPRLPKFGETMFGHSFHMGYGGKGANQAVMAAKLGAHVSMVTKLGRDVFGNGTLQNLQDQGINTQWVLFDDHLSSGVAPIFVDDSAQNFVVIVAGANSGLSPADVRAARDSILAAGTLICQLEVPIETTLEALRIAKSGGVRTILNPAPATTVPDEMLQLSDIVVPNETETELLTGMPAASPEQAEAAAHRLLQRGAGSVILTLGERGALFVSKGATESIPGVEVDAIDPTGAGDAFVGSLANFLGEGRPMRDAIRQANGVAALSVTRIGTQTSFPKRAEADVFLEERGCFLHGIDGLPG